MSVAQNLEQLLAPIAGDNPAGIYLKGDRSAYRPLRNSYNVAQTSFRKLTNNPADEELEELELSNQASWKELSRLLMDVVAGQSKDLECISWLTLAQLFTPRPYRDLAASLKLMAGVVSQYGEHVQPRVPDNKLRAQDDVGRRTERASLQLRPVVQMFGESEESCLLGMPLRMLPLIAGIDYTAWKSAEGQGGRAELQQQARQALADEQQDVVARVLALNSAVEALDEVDQVLGEYADSCGTVKVNSRFLRYQLTANLNALKSLTEGALVPWPLDALQQEAVEAPEPIQEDVASSESETGQQSGQAQQVTERVRSGMAEPVYNRDQAFQQLRLIANYFARTEPQSPISSMIEKVIRWGYTPLPDLINELVQGHDGLMGRITELTGMGSEKVHIPGVPAQGLVAPPSEVPQAPSQQMQQVPAEPVAATVPVEKFKYDNSAPSLPNIEVPVGQAESVQEESHSSSSPSIPNFVNLPVKEEKKPEVKQPSGPGGIDLASLGIM